MHFRKVASGIALAAATLSLLFSANAAAESWSYMTTRYKDHVTLEADYDSIHEEKEWLLFNIKYSSQIGYKPTYPDLDYRFEKFAVSCSRKVGKTLYAEQLYLNGNREVISPQVSLEDAKEIPIRRGSEISQITYQLCSEQSTKDDAARSTIQSKMLPNGLNSVEWQYVTSGQDGNSKVFISPSSISMHEEGIVSFVGKFDFAVPQPLQNGGTFTTSTNLTFIDCKNSTYAMTLYDYYDNNNHLVDTYSQDPKDPKVYPIEKGSIISFAEEKVCSNKIGGTPTFNLPDPANNNLADLAKPKSRYAPNGIHTDDWVFIGEAGKGSYFVKKGSLENKNNNVVFVGGLTFQTPQTSPHGKPYIFGAELTYFDCSAKLYSNEDTELFDTQGNFVDIIPASIEEKNPHQIHNDSNKKIEDYVCQAASNYDTSKNNSNTGDKEEESISTGTAWQISRTQLVTANHVVSHADSIVLMINANDIRKADVIMRDPANDIAILQIQGAPLTTPPLKLASKQARLGSKIAVLGFPLPDVLGAKVQATSGEISGLGGIRNDPRFYQISAAIQSGNSGSPLLNQNGEVIGVVSSKLNDANMLKERGELPQNVNFAVKQSYLQPLIESAGIVLDTPSKKINRIEDAINQSKDSVYLVIVSSPPEH
ncbi:MAG TPA: serine protease [Methylophilaceae bacterium]|jgi:S1-C subfamily serine protease